MGREARDTDFIFTGGLWPGRWWKLDNLYKIKSEVAQGKSADNVLLDKPIKEELPFGAVARDTSAHSKESSHDCQTASDDGDEEEISIVRQNLR